MEKTNKKTCFLSLLTKEQKKQFQEYYVKKVYRSELTISAIVAATQLLMIALLFINSGGVISPVLANPYFYLYLTLLIPTVAILPVYIIMIKTERYLTLIRIKRINIMALCAWVMGITVLDQLQGVGLGVYCYLIPTMAAVLLISPLECVTLYGLQWIILMIVLWMANLDSAVFFSSAVNSFFTTILAVFISVRHYRSMETEFYDTETIKAQYIEIQATNQALSEMAYTDQLTGLYNRRYLSEKFLPDFDGYKQQRRYMEVLMIDIDYFKQYNDFYGHMQGDDCLQRISAVLKSCIQERSGAAIRFGGEEFLVLYTPAEEDGTFSLAEYIQNAIHQEQIPRSDTENPYVTMSIGVWQDRLKESDTLDKLISHADKALYLAKSSGRNCIKSNIA